METWGGGDIRPPLPSEVVRLLESSCLCFLSTFSDNHPHLSLMNFTYVARDEVIVLSTRRDTKKFKLVEQAPNVAILVHDFSSVRANPQGGGTSPGGGARTLTITLNGPASIE
ncbi:unnamed protein product, partial [Choristocarpus tenellus]